MSPVNDSTSVDTGFGVNDSTSVSGRSDVCGSTSVSAVSDVDDPGWKSVGLGLLCKKSCCGSDCIGEFSRLSFQSSTWSKSMGAAKRYSLETHGCQNGNCQSYINAGSRSVKVPRDCSPCPVV